MRLEALELELQSVQERLSAAEEMNTVSETYIREMTSCITVMQAEKGELQLQLEQSSEETVSLRSSLEGAKAKVKTLEQDLHGFFVTGSAPAPVKASQDTGTLPIRRLSVMNKFYHLIEFLSAL